MVFKQKTRRQSKKQKIQKGGACSTLAGRQKEKEKIQTVLDSLENLPIYLFDNQDYSKFKLTIIPKGTVFYFRTQKQLDKISNHPLWLDYTQSVGKESYLHWPPRVISKKALEPNSLPSASPVDSSSSSSASSSPSASPVPQFFNTNNNKNPEPPKFEKDILAHFARKVIGLYGPWLNTVVTNADVMCLHFPLNPLNPNAEESYTSECEEMIKTITGAAHYWDLEMKVQAYTLDFFPDSDATYKDKIPAPYGYRELAIHNRFLAFVSSEYDPLPPEVAYTREEYQIMREFKNSVIRQRNNYKEAKGNYLIRVAKGEADPKGVRENNKPLLQKIKDSLEQRAFEMPVQATD